MKFSTFSMNENNTASEIHFPVMNIFASSSSSSSSVNQKKEEENQLHTTTAITRPEKTTQNLFCVIKYRLFTLYIMLITMVTISM